MARANAKPVEAYKDTEISTANQGKLIVMLYDGATRFLRLAMDNLNPRTYDIANSNIIKCQDIVTELMLSLNMDGGGEIAQNLFNLYAYMKKRLLEGNIQKDRAVLEEVLGLLEQLKGAWEEVSTREASRPEPAPSRTTEGVSFSIHG